MRTTTLAGRLTRMGFADPARAEQLLTSDLALDISPDEPAAGPGYGRRPKDEAVLEAIAGAADPDLALQQLARIADRGEDPDAAEIRAALRIEPVKMDFHYGTSFGKASPEAYERLLLDAMSGDATLFARRDEVEGAWRFIDQIEHAWHQAPNPPPVCEYPSGSWGPKEADELLARDGRTWRRM